MIYFSTLFMSSLLLSPGFLGTATADESAKNTLGLNFDISFEEMVWSETTSGDFNLFLDYKIGANATDLSIGLYQSGCVTPYTLAGSADAIIEVLTKNNTDVDKNVFVNKRLLSVDNTELVTHDKSKGMSKGSLEFCVKAETWVDSISAAFHKQNLKLTFDLSVNSFEVLNNDITTGGVPGPNPDVTATLGEADCTCDALTYDTPTECSFDDTYMEAKFDSFPSTGVFGQNPIIRDDVFTFTNIMYGSKDIMKHIVLLRSRFETDANGENQFSGLEMKMYGISCVQPPPVRRLEIPHRQLTSVYANVVITDVLNFVFDLDIGKFFLDYTAIVTGDINGESATVSHAGSLSFEPPDGKPVIDSATVAVDVIGLSVLTVDTSKYTVTVCHCTKTTYDCREGVLPPYSQNSMIYLCVQPNATVQNTVEVSNFFMEFKHGTDVKYTPVTIGTKVPKPNTLSIIQKSDPSYSYRVATRLITALFDGGATKFDVAGNAYLEFKQRRRLHGRSLQDTPAGESFFKMEVQFKKGVAPANDVTRTDGKSGLVLISVGALLVLSTAFVILKKMKK